MQTSNRVVQVYTIYDTVALDSGPLFFAPNHETAFRNYQNTMKDVPYAADYRLLHLGSMDCTLGIINPLPIGEEVSVPTLVKETVLQEVVR